ncbi:MAG: SdpI family protein [Clostridia bacterium]|nr:SdpI family protein [Clostridia bacterium]
MLGFWIFMLLMDFLIPLMMIGIGRLFMKRPPKRINGIYGYRTKRSMKTQETWDFAHCYLGNLWFKIGLVLIPLSALPLIFVYGKDVDLIGTVGAVVTLFEIFPMIVPIFPTERALKENFDEYGKPL